MLSTIAIFVTVLFIHFYVRKPTFRAENHGFFQYICKYPLCTYCISQKTKYSDFRKVSKATLPSTLIMKTLIAATIITMISISAAAGPYVIHEHNANYAGKSHLADNSTTSLGYNFRTNRSSVYGELGITDHGKEAIEFGIKIKVKDKLIVKTRWSAVNNDNNTSQLKTQIIYEF